MSSLFILKIYYYEDKLNLSEITNDELELDELESFTEFIKVKKLDEIKIDSYVNYYEYNYTTDFLVHHHNKLYLHSKKLPINYRKPIKSQGDELKYFIYGLITNRTMGTDHIASYLKKRYGPSIMSYGSQDKILLFSQNHDINISDISDINLTIIKINNENEIWNEISKYNFMDEYKDNYLIVNRKIIKVKHISMSHNTFKIVKTENLSRLIRLLKDEENYECVVY